MNRISLEVYEAVEAWYAKMQAKEHGKIALYRKAFYLLYLSGHYPKELFNPKMKPVMEYERYKLGKDIVKIVKLRLFASARHKGSIGEKTFNVPVFLDYKLDKDNNKVIYIEEAMWDIITDSWAFMPYTLDFGKLGANAGVRINQKLKEVIVKGYKNTELSEIPLKPKDLRELRIYDLLSNHADLIGQNPYVVEQIIGLRDNQYLRRSPMFRMSFSDFDLLSFMRQNASSSQAQE